MRGSRARTVKNSAPFLRPEEPSTNTRERLTNRNKPVTRQSTADSKQGYAASRTKQETVEITRKQADIVKCGRGGAVQQRGGRI